MPSEEQKTPPQEGSRLNKFKILSTSVLKLGFGSFLLCVVGAVLIASSFWGYEEWVKKQRSNRALALAGRNLNLFAPAINGTASLSLKYAKDQKVKYNLKFTIHEGFAGEAKGSITVHFLDKDNFAVFHHSFDTLSPMIESDRIVGYSELGEIGNVDPEDFFNTNHIEIGQNLSIKKIALPENLVPHNKSVLNQEGENRVTQALDSQGDLKSDADIGDLKVHWGGGWRLEGILKNPSSTNTLHAIKIRVVINDESNNAALSVGDTVKEIKNLDIPPGQGRKIGESLYFGSYPPQAIPKWSSKLSTVEVK